MWSITLLREAAELVEYIYNVTHNEGDAALLSPVDNGHVVERAKEIMTRKLHGG